MVLIKQFFSTFFLVALLSALTANAALDIEITGGNAQQIPIAVLPFGNTASTKDNINEIIAADLARSGLFRLLETRGMANLPITPAQINYAQWTAMQAQAITVGNVEAISGGRFKVRFQLMDALNRPQ